MRDASLVPFFELGLWEYHDAEGAKRECARGLLILAERKRETAEAKRRNIEAVNERRREEREQRNEEIVRLVAEGNSHERIAELFGLNAKTVRELVGEAERCLANPHGYAPEKQR